MNDFDDYSPSDLRPADESAGFPRINWTELGEKCDAFLAKREVGRLTFRDFVRADATGKAKETAHRRARA